VDPIPAEPLSAVQAFRAILNIAQTPTTQVTTQKLQFFAPEGYSLGTATFDRTFSNMQDGKLRSFVTAGRFVPNFTFQWGEPSYGP